MASGPNGSSCITRAWSGTPASTVGSKEVAASVDAVSPRLTRVAPVSTASATKSVSAVIRRPLASGPHLNRFGEAVPNDRRGAPFGEAVEEPVVDCLVDEESRGRGAHLPCVAHFANRRGHCRFVDVGVFAHDDGGMGHRVPSAPVSCDLEAIPVRWPTDRRRTGEGHEFRDRARDEVVGDVGRDTEDEIEHPVGEAGVFERLKRCA